RTDAGQTVSASVVVAAHGSWEPGRLPTQKPRPPASPSDLLAFKAHFTGSDLASGLMPLLAFPGGYGGMVHCDGGRVSLSCCVRRDCLAHIWCPGREAGEGVLDHVRGCWGGLLHPLAFPRGHGRRPAPGHRGRRCG